MSWRNLSLPLKHVAAACLAVATCLAADHALAQSAPHADPSPFAPGDLKRPIFDTQTSIYGRADQQEKSAGTIVAEVDGRPVTLSDVAEAIKKLPAGVSSLPFADLFPGVLHKLIIEQALVVRATQQGLDEDPTVRRKVKAAVDQVMADEVLRQELTSKITEKALLNRYDREIAGKPGPDQVHVRVIMLPTEEAASSIIAELRSGADFATLARRSSTDTTAQVGGDLGFLSRDALSVEIGAVAFAMQPNEVAPFPVRSAGAWFVVKAEERRKSSTPSFAAVREQLLQELIREGGSGHGRQGVG